MGKRSSEESKNEKSSKKHRSESVSSDSEDDEFLESVNSEEDEEEDAINVDSEEDENEEGDSEGEVVSENEFEELDSEEERDKQEQEELRKKFFKLFDTSDDQKLKDRCKTFKDFSEIEWILSDLFLFYKDRPNRLPVVVKSYQKVFKQYGSEHIIPDMINTIETEDEIEYFIKYADFMHHLVLENGPTFEGLVKYIDMFPEHFCVESFFRIMKDKLGSKFIKNEIQQDIFQTKSYLRISKTIDFNPQLPTLVRFIAELIKMDDIGRFAKILDECYDEPDMLHFFSMFLPYFEKDHLLINKLIRKSPKSPKTMKKMANVLLLTLRAHFAIAPILSHKDMKDDWDFLSILFRTIPTTKHLSLVLETVVAHWDSENFKEASQYYLQLALVNTQILPIASVMYFVKVLGIERGAVLVKDIEIAVGEPELTNFARYLQNLPKGIKSRQCYEFFRSLLPSNSERYNIFLKEMNKFFDALIKYQTDETKTMEIIKGVFMFVKIPHIETKHVVQLSKSWGDDKLASCLANVKKKNFLSQICELLKTEMPDDPLTVLIQQTFAQT